MQHRVSRVVYANPDHKRRGILTAEAVCGQIAHVQWRPGVRVANPGEPMNTTNQPGGACPRCYPDQVQDPNGAQALHPIAGSSFLQPSNGPEMGQNGDVLGGYSVEGEDQVSSDGRLGNVAVVGGIPIKSTEVSHGVERLGGYVSSDGLGQAVEITDSDQVDRLTAEERRRQHRV